jgi:hypothetical protein
MRRFAAVARAACAAAWVALAAPLAGCASLLGIEDLTGATDDGPVLAQVVVSGVVQISQPGHPGYATAVSLIKPDGTALITGTSGADGKFSLSAPTGGAPLDVALHIVGQTPEARATYVYFPPLRRDRDIGAVVVLYAGDVQYVAGTFGYSFNPSMTLHVIQVHDSRGKLAAGARLTTQPNTIIIDYTSDGAPTHGDATTTDGTAYAFDYSNQITTLGTTGAVTVAARNVRANPSSVLLVDLRP